MLSFTTGVVNKYMLAGGNAGSAAAAAAAANLGSSIINNYDDMQQQLNAAHAAALANAAAMAAAAAAAASSASNEPLSGGEGSGHPLMANGHTGTSPAPPQTSSYSLNAIKYMIDSSAGGPMNSSLEQQHSLASSNHHQGMEVDGEQQHQQHPHHHLRHGPNHPHNSSPHSPASLLSLNSKALSASGLLGEANGQTTMMANSSGGMMISSSSCAASPTAAAASAGSNDVAKGGNKNDGSSAAVAAAAGEPGHFNFKKDIKDRFQKVLDRMSDGSTASSSASSRNSSSASSFNSDGTAEASPPVSGGGNGGVSAGIIPPSNASSSLGGTGIGVPTVVDTTAAVNQIVCQLSSSGSLSSNSSSSTLSASETKSVANDLQMISLMHSIGAAGAGDGVGANAGANVGANAGVNVDPASHGESKPSKERIDIEAMYQKLSSNLLNTLSSLITACTSEYSSLEGSSVSGGSNGSGASGNLGPNSSSSSGAESVYVPIYAMHPSGHYYVPMHIEAAILGMKEEYTKSNKFPSKPPNYSSNNISSTNTASKLANGDGGSMGGAADYEHGGEHGELTLTTLASEQHQQQQQQLEGRSAKKMRYDREPTVLLSQSIKFAFNSRPPAEVFGRSAEQATAAAAAHSSSSQQVMLYPMTITVNLSHHQNVSLHTVFSFLREMLCRQAAESGNCSALNGCCSIVHSSGGRASGGRTTTTIGHAIEELKRQSIVAGGKSGRFSTDDLCGVDLSARSLVAAGGKPAFPSSAFSSPSSLLDNKPVHSQHHLHSSFAEGGGSTEGSTGSTMLAKHLLAGKRPASPPPPPAATSSVGSLTPSEIAQMVAANQVQLTALTNSVDLSSTAPPSASATAAQMMMMLAAAAHNLEKSGGTDQQQEHALNALSASHLTAQHHHYPLDSLQGGPFGSLESVSGAKKGSLFAGEDHHPHHPQHMSAFSAIDDPYALKDRKAISASGNDVNSHVKSNGIVKPIATTPLGHHHRPHHQQHPHSVNSIAPLHLMPHHHPSLLQEPVSEVKPEMEHLMNSSLYHKLTAPAVPPSSSASSSSGKLSHQQQEPSGAHSRNSHTPTLIIPNVPTSTSSAASSVPLTLPPGTSLHSLAHSSVYNGGVYGGHHLFGGTPTSAVSVSASTSSSSSSSISADQHHHHPREHHHSSLFSPPMSVLNGGGGGLRSPPPPPSPPGSALQQQQQQLGLRGGVPVSTSGSSAAAAAVAAPSLASYLQPHALGQLNLSNYYSSLWASQLASGAGSSSGNGATPYSNGNALAGGSASSIADFAAASSSSSATANIHKGSPMQSGSAVGGGGGGNNSGNGLHPKTTNTIANAVAAVAAANAAAAASSANPYGMLSLFNSGPGGSADQYSLFGGPPRGSVLPPIGSPSGGGMQHSSHQLPPPPIIQSISLDQYGLNSSLAAAAAAAAAAASANSSNSGGKSGTANNKGNSRSQPASSEPSRPGSALTPMNLSKETAAAAAASAKLL